MVVKFPSFQKVRRHNTKRIPGTNALVSLAYVENFNSILSIVPAGFSGSGQNSADLIDMSGSAGTLPISGNITQKRATRIDLWFKTFFFFVLVL